MPKLSNITKLFKDAKEKIDNRAKQVADRLDEETEKLDWSDIGYADTRSTVTRIFQGLGKKIRKPLARLGGADDYISPYGAEAFAKDLRKNLGSLDGLFVNSKHKFSSTVDHFPRIHKDIPLTEDDIWNIRFNASGISAPPTPIPANRESWDYAVEKGRNSFRKYDNLPEQPRTPLQQQVDTTTTGNNNTSSGTTTTSSGSNGNNSSSGSATTPPDTTGTSSGGNGATQSTGGVVPPKTEDITDDVLKAKLKQLRDKGGDADIEAANRIEKEMNTFNELFNGEKFDEAAKMVGKTGTYTKNNAQELKQEALRRAATDADSGPGFIDYVNGHRVISTTAGIAIGAGTISAINSNGGRRSNSDLYGSPY